MSRTKLDFVDILTTPQETLEHIMAVAMELKAQHKSTGRNTPLASGQVLALIFEKPSLRTRISFEVAMRHLDGSALYISPAEIGIGTRESAADVARILSGFCNGIMARTFSHQTVLDLARYGSVPVINGLSDFSHPCQAMADIMTAQEHFGHLKGLTLAFIGDGNNVARSLAEACGRFGMRFRIATPPGYELPADQVADLHRQLPGLDFAAFVDPADAVRQADILYTDTWVSMGQEAEKATRCKIFAPYQINEKLLAAAPAQAVVMHCLPAYRGLEITDEVIEGPRSLVFPEAENRLHFQKGLLAVQLGGR